MVRQKRYGMTVLVLGVTALFAFTLSADHRTARRLGVADPVQYFVSQLPAGLPLERVASQVPAPDVVGFSRMERGDLVQELRYRVPLAPDFRVFAVFRDSVLVDVEFDPQYLGSTTPLGVS